MSCLWIETQFHTSHNWERRTRSRQCIIIIPYEMNPPVALSYILFCLH